VQLLLVRHALPLRSEPGEGSDPDLSEAGVEQARRLPDALARFPITRLLASRSGTLAVAAVNGTEHVWDLLPRNVRW
jgi:broad specificity phosphatase PhoE